MHVATERTYTLADLKNWPSCIAQWPGDWTALAVIGRPVGHSLSPVMHNAALGELTKSKPDFARWRYFKFDIAPEELAAAVDLFHQKKFRGLNLTVPHKALVIPHLAAKDSFVQDAGAANTLSSTKTGWSGANTDGYGLAAALHQELGLKLRGANIILLGAGGAARGAAVECLSEKCASLWIGNRTKATLDELLNNLKAAKAFDPITQLSGFDPSQPPATLPGEAVVINATSLGLKTDDGTPIDLTKIPRPAKIYDMIYRPPQTALLRQASALKIPYANGLSMLVHQGARSLELWTGEIAPVEIMQDAVRDALTNS